MGKTPRTDFSNNKKGVPGPGSYTPKSEFGKTAPVFGSSVRPPLCNIVFTPGPGQYEWPKTKDGPAFSMRPRTANIRGDAYPGPGHYNPGVSTSEVKWSIGKEQKGLDYGLSKSVSMPGPGFYKTTSTLAGPKWGFGSSTRNKNDKYITPGPGAYNLYSSISNLPSYVLQRSYNR